MNDNKAIQLTDRFFNGETTLGEEQELYAYFLSDKVCPQLMPLRQMFLDMSQLQGIEPTQKAKVVSINRRKRWLRVAIAAAVVATVGITATMWTTRHDHDYEMMAYGQRQDNREAVMREVERTLDDARSGTPNVGAELKDAFKQFQ